MDIENGPLELVAHLEAGRQMLQLTTTCLAATLATKSEMGEMRQALLEHVDLHRAEHRVFPLGDVELLGLNAAQLRYVEQAYTTEMDRLYRALQTILALTEG